MVALNPALRAEKGAVIGLNHRGTKMQRLTEIPALEKMNDAPLGLEGSEASHLENAFSEWQTTEPSTAHCRSSEPIHFTAHAKECF